MLPAARRGWRVVSRAALREQRLRRAFYFPSPTSQVVYFERADPNGHLTRQETDRHKQQRWVTMGPGHFELTVI